MKSLWPDTLAGRTLSLLILITLLLLLAAVWLLHDQQQQQFDRHQQFRLLEQLVTSIKLLNQASPQDRQKLLGQLSVSNASMHLDAQPMIRGAHPGRPFERALTERLREQLAITQPGGVRLRIPMHTAHQGSGDSPVIRISIRLDDGQWLNLIKHRASPPPWEIATLKWLAVVVIILLAAAWLLVKRLTGPVVGLGRAAEKFGIDEMPAMLAENGPLEVRQAISAFNRMQQRLHRQIQDRAMMLAAVSHDLRTPITTLRLRCEYVSDDETRKKMLATLSDMEAIVNATLDFSRDESHAETARQTDIAALLQSLADDYSDRQEQVGYSGPDHYILRCRPVALRRAIVNLIDNALRYAGQARIRLAPASDRIRIDIEDNGPGIPQHELEQVFRPFYRLEPSRNLQSGGIGLGLATARRIVLAHDGEITLANLPEGGLAVSIFLPAEQSA